MLYKKVTALTEIPKSLWSWSYSVIKQDVPTPNEPFWNIGRKSKTVFID